MKAETTEGFFGPAFHGVAEIHIASNRIKFIQTIALNYLFKILSQVKNGSKHFSEHGDILFLPDLTWFCEYFVFDELLGVRIQNSIHSKVLFGFFEVSNAMVK